MNKELVFLMILTLFAINTVSWAAILKFKMAAINGIFSLASTLKMLGIALSNIVPNFMLLSKSAQLFHISAQLIMVYFYTSFQNSDSATSSTYEYVPLSQLGNIVLWIGTKNNKDINLQ